MLPTLLLPYSPTCYFAKEMSHKKIYQSRRLAIAITVLQEHIQSITNQFEAHSPYCEGLHTQNSITRL